MMKVDYVQRDARYMRFEPREKDFSSRISSCATACILIGCADCRLRDRSRNIINQIILKGEMSFGFETESAG